MQGTVIIERAIDSLRRKGIPINEQLITYLSPLVMGTYQPERGLRVANKPETDTG